MNIVDFSNCIENDRSYGGNAGEKLGVIYQNENWLLKFPKSTKYFDNVGLSYTTSALSEFIGSHIYDILNIPVHETLLGIMDGKLVVACKDFLEKGEELKEFRQLKNMYNRELTDLLAKSDSGGSGDGTNLKVVLSVIEKNKILSTIPQAKERFWEMFIVDAFINNNDRNNGNWGVILGKDGSYRLAPVYDNGNSFSNKMTDQEALRKMRNPEALDGAAFNIFSAFFDEEERQIAPFRFLKTMEDADCLAAMKRIVPTIHEQMDRIRDFVSGIPEEHKGCLIISSPYKKFILETLSMREKKLGAILKEHVLVKNKGIKGNMQVANERSARNDHRAVKSKIQTHER